MSVRWMGAQEAAKYLGIDYKTVRLMAHAEVNPLPAWYPPGNSKVWKTNDKALDEWAEGTWKRV